MGSLLALLSSVLWGTADYLAGNLSKRYKAIAVTGVSQFFGLLFGISAILLFSDFITPNLSWDGYLIPGVIAGIAGFIGLVSFYTGLATGRMGVVSPISSLSVVIPLIFALASRIPVQVDAYGRCVRAGSATALAGKLALTQADASVTRGGMAAMPVFSHTGTPPWPSASPPTACSASATATSPALLTIPPISTC